MACVPRFVTRADFGGGPMTTGDVDLATGVVTIRRAFSAGKLQTPKSRRVRQVPIVGELGSILARMTNGRRPVEPVLLGPLGGRLYHSNFRTKVQWRGLVCGLGWPGLRFHDLWATAIVLWIRAEVPLTTVRALAGHASLATTDRYARIARNDLAGAAEKVDSYISRTAAGVDQRGKIRGTTSQQGGCCGAGDENRTRTISLGSALSCLLTSD